MSRYRQWLYKGLIAALTLAGFIAIILIMRSNRTVLIADDSQPSAQTVSVGRTELSTGAVIAADAAAQSELFPVHVAGAVSEPGVYFFKRGDIADDAVVAAGGLTAEADAGRLNLAAVLEPHGHLYIPSVDEAGALPFQVEVAADVTGVSINTATVEELKTLPGIGETKALAIIRYREEHGPFTRLEDLMNVPGIKQGSFANLEGLIRL